jgi:hypothetical protein
LAFETTKIYYNCPDQIYEFYLHTPEYTFCKHEFVVGNYDIFNHFFNVLVLLYVIRYFVLADKEVDN